MNDVYIRAILAGVFFGMWPLLMNRSGLAGNLSSAVFAGIAFITVLPFALKEGLHSFQTATVSLAVAAGVCGAIGLLAFNGMLARVSKERVGTMFVLMILVQVTVPIIYQAVMTGDYSAKRVVGSIAALIAVILLA